MNSKKREKIEIKYLLRLLRRTFFRRVLPPPISHLLVFALCFLGYLILQSCSTTHSSVFLPSSAPAASHPRVKAIGCHQIEGWGPGLLPSSELPLVFWGIRGLTGCYPHSFPSELIEFHLVSPFIGLCDRAWHQKYTWTLMDAFKPGAFWEFVLLCWNFLSEYSLHHSVCLSRSFSFSQVGPVMVVGSTLCSSWRKVFSNTSQFLSSFTVRIDWPF